MYRFDLKFLRERKIIISFELLLRKMKEVFFFFKSVFFSYRFLKEIKKK